MAALALALLLSGNLAAAPHQAAPGGIRVISDTWRVEFPHRVVFHLAAEAPGDIIEVRLRFRPAGGGTWSYVYPQFRPGRSVAATGHLTTGSANYLPPGAKIEYHYQLRDSRGNRLDTPVAALAYEDTRFRWEQTQAGPLTLQHYGLSRSRVEQDAGESEAGLRRLQDLLGMAHARPIKGIIYNERADARDAFPVQSRTTARLHVFAGFAFSRHDLFLGLGMDPDLIVHESAHLLLAQALGPAAGSLPDWLDEGFASYVEPGAHPYSGRSLSEHGLPLRAMSRVGGKPDDIGFFYLKAESVVAYLMESHGPERFRHFLDWLRRGRPVDEALAASYGFDTDGLEYRWAQWEGGFDGAPPAAPSRVSPFVYLDIWLFGGLFLLVMIVVTLRYVIRKLRPDPNPEEGLQPWEDPDLVDDDD